VPAPGWLLRQRQRRSSPPSRPRRRTPIKPARNPKTANGFYRFKIGDFQATVISDGYGQLPIRPILAMNVSEAELAPVLKANFMQPVIQATSNILVVDTGRERILVDTGWGEKLGRRVAMPVATALARSIHQSRD
jgi:hypothetical protein